MKFRFAYILVLILLPFSVHAGYIGEDLGTDFYQRISKGHYTLKRQLIEQRLKGSAQKINDRVGQSCKKEDGTMDYCFDSGNDFTASELDALAKGRIDPITGHLKSEFRKTLTTDQVQGLSQKIQGFYVDVQNETAKSQKKLQSIGTIGLYSDGNIDNSEYDIMYDIEKIHEIIFDHDISYNGTVNMGSESVGNLLAGLYDAIGDGADTQPYSPTNPIPSGSWSVYIYTGATSSGNTTSGGSGAYCPPGTSGLPNNLDLASIDSAAKQQEDTGRNNGPTYSLMDNGFLPEYWAHLGGAPKGRLGGKWSLLDSFPCSSSDIFCITIQFVMYDHNLLIGGKAYTIEHILDENLKIANRYAASSLAQSKMTHGFFQCDFCGSIDLPSMLHLSTVVTSLPPPILNLSQKWSAADEMDRREKKERDEIYPNVFKDKGLSYKRQNAIEEDDLKALGISQLQGLNTDAVPKKIEVGGILPGDYVAAKEKEMRNRYDLSLGDDLLQFQSFSVAFTERLHMLSTLITALHDIPTK